MSQKDNTQFPQSVALRERYLIHEVLEGGGLSEVLRATDVQTGQAVAIKRSRLVDSDSRALLLREARLLAEVAHPALVPILDVFREGNAVYLVQPLVAGRILGDWWKEAELAEILAALVQVAGALAALAARGIVHRDVKPENILVEPNGAVHLIDFGLAVILAEPDRLTHSESTVVGTPRYMTPEMLLGSEVGPSADIFSLGLVLFEGITGRTPWAETHVRETMAARFKELPEGARQALTKYEKLGLPRLIEAMLDIDPARRPTAAEVRDALESAVARCTSLKSIPRSIRRRTTGRDVGAAPSPRSKMFQLRNALVLIGVLLGVSAIALFGPCGQPRVSPGTASARDAIGAGVSTGELVLWAVLLAMGTASIIAGTVRASRSRALHEREIEAQELLHRRLQAIESQLARMADLSDSFVLRLQKLQDETRVRKLATRSMIAPLGSAEALAPPPPDLALALARLAEALKDDRPAPPKLHERIGPWVAVIGGLVAALAGVVGIGGSVGMLSFNQRPTITEFEIWPTRIRRGASLALLSVRATDPDGDVLTYSFRASHGEITEQGSSALWATTGPLDAKIVSFSVTVSDGHDVVHQDRSVAINEPPKGTIEFAGNEGLGDDIPAGHRLPLIVRVIDLDPEVTYRWATDCGTLDRANVSSPILTMRDQLGPCRVHCTLSDGLDQATSQKELRVVAPPKDP